MAVSEYLSLLHSGSGIPERPFEETEGKADIFLRIGQNRDGAQLSLKEADIDPTSQEKCQRNCSHLELAPSTSFPEYLLHVPADSGHTTSSTDTLLSDLSELC